MPKANGNDISVILSDQADGDTEEQAAFEQAAVVPNVNTAGISSQIKPDDAKPAEVSNWLFVIPVTLAIVSLGIAIHKRVPPRRRGFKRLQDRNGSSRSLFQEDINPFCTSEEDAETPGHFEGEEDAFIAQPETEDDEISKAEKEIIKQAVMLHIKEFDDENEDEVEV